MGVWTGLAISPWRNRPETRSSQAATAFSSRFTWTAFVTLGKTFALTILSILSSSLSKLSFASSFSEMEEKRKNPTPRQRRRKTTPIEIKTIC